MLGAIKEVVKQVWATVIVNSLVTDATLYEARLQIKLTVTVLGKSDFRDQQL
jgi:hypothetical protein